MMDETTLLSLDKIDRNTSESLNNVGTNFKPMPRPGYTCITIPRTLHQRLKEEARRRKVSIPQLISQLLSTSTSTSTHGNRENPGKSLFQENETGPGGIEPPTNRLRACRSTVLSYGPFGFTTSKGFSSILNFYSVLHR